MAHIEKYKAHSVGHMLAHYRRDPSSLARDNVDPSLTKRNVTLGHVTNDQGVWSAWSRVDLKPNWETVERRIEKVNAAAKAAGKRVTRKDAVVMADVVVTLPRNVPPRDSDRFFMYTYTWLGQKLGRDNMMGGFVHRDEVRKDGSPVRDHMHAPFTPILDGRFNYKQMVPRSFYKTMHKELGDYLEQELGYRPEVELEAKTVADKVASKLDHGALDAMQSEIIDPAKAEAERIVGEARARVADLERQRVETHGKLSGLKTEVAKKQAQAADLSGQIAEKMVERDEISAQIERFSKKEDAVRQRLESVQGELAAVESFEAKGMGELAKLAADREAQARERAAGERNRELRGRVEALQAERAGIEGRIGELERANRGMRAALDGLRARLERAGELVIEAIERCPFAYLEGVGEAVAEVLRGFGMRAYAGNAPLSERLAEAQAVAAAYEPGLDLRDHGDER